MRKKIKDWIKNKFFENRDINQDDIDMEELEKMVKNGALLLDVRSPQEYEEGHMDGAILIPEYELKRDAEKILTNKEEIIIAYCSTGTRSKKAQKELKEKGYKYVYNLYNGLEM